MGCIHLMLQQACFHSTEKNKILFLWGSFSESEQTQMLKFMKHTAPKNMYKYHTATGNVTSKLLECTIHFKYSRMLEVMCKDLSRPVLEARLFLSPVK